MGCQGLDIDRTWHWFNTCLRHQSHTQREKPAHSTILCWDEFHFALFHYFPYLLLFHSRFIVFSIFSFPSNFIALFFLSYLLFYSYLWLPHCSFHLSFSYFCYSFSFFIPFSCFSLSILYHISSLPFPPPIIIFLSFGLLWFFIFYFTLSLISISLPTFIILPTFVITLLLLLGWDFTCSGFVFCVALLCSTSTWCLMFLSYSFSSLPSL